MTNKQMQIEQMKALGRQNKWLAEERKRLTKEHEEYLKHDIVEIYSALIVVLWNNGNQDQDAIEDIISQIQKEWTYHVKERAPKTGQTMADYCSELTGIDIRDETC